MQVKFSELTLDMFRILQTLEREPQEDLSNQLYDTSPAPGRTPFVSICHTMSCCYSHFVASIDCLFSHSFNKPDAHVQFIGLFQHFAEYMPLLKVHPEYC